MNSAFTKVSNLKVNKASKIAITLASSTFFLYALGQAPIFKNILAGGTLFHKFFSLVNIAVPYLCLRFINNNMNYKIYSLEIIRN